MFKNLARGFFAAILILVVFEAINDFLLTFASDLVDNVEFQFAFRATIVAFVTAFIAAYVATERIHQVAAALIVAYWIAISVYRYSTAVGATEIGYITFVTNGFRTIVPSIVFGWLGAFLGWKYYVREGRSGRLQSRRTRNMVVTAAAVIVLLVSPNMYSWYWEGQAIDQLRTAVQSIRLGNMPENVDPLENDFYDLTSDVEMLVGALTSETTYKVHHKIGVGFHSYQVEIWPDGRTNYNAIVGYDDWDGWSILCCWSDDP